MITTWLAIYIVCELSLGLPVTLNETDSKVDSTRGCDPFAIASVLVYCKRYNSLIFMLSMT